VRGAVCVTLEKDLGLFPKEWFSRYLRLARDRWNQGGPSRREGESWLFRYHLRQGNVAPSSEFSLAQRPKMAAIRAAVRRR
jgi:hypothetical protein